MKTSGSRQDENGKRASVQEAAYIIGETSFLACRRRKEEKESRRAVKYSLFG
jgi:hypothetical protein